VDHPESDPPPVARRAEELTGHGAGRGVLDDGEVLAVVAVDGLLRLDLYVSREATSASTKIVSLD
jgi:hypothetical protein